MKVGNTTLFLILATISLPIGYVVLTKFESVPIPGSQSNIQNNEPNPIRRSSELQPTVASTNTSIVEQSSSEPTNQSNEFESQFRDPIVEMRRLGMDTSEDSIRNALADKTDDPDTRYLSAMALGKMKSDDAVMILTEILEHDEDLDVRTGAIVGLSYLEDAGSITILEEFLNHDPNDTIRVGVVSALYRINSDSGREVLSKTVVDQSQLIGVREQALDVLALTKTPDIYNTMRVLLVDPQPVLRARAAVALSADHKEEAVSYLVDSALNDALPINVWGAVVQALQEISGDRLTKIKPNDYLQNPALRSATNEDIENRWRNSTSSRQ